MNWATLLDLKGIITNALGTILAAVIIAIFSTIVLKPFRDWLYKQSPNFRNFVFKVIDILTIPYLRLAVFFLSLNAIYLDLPYKFTSFVLAFITFMSFFDTEKKIQAVSRNSSQFSDDFSTREIDYQKWKIKTGHPDFFFEMGHPRLNLKMASPPEATNSFLIVKNQEVERGSITCDVYLPPEAVFDIVFFCDEKAHNWHMARFDSRKTEYDGFLIKDAGPGANWRINTNSPYRTEDSQWHTVRVDFDTERARMYRDGKFLVEVINPPMFGKKVGLFNEVKDVLVNNFVLSYQK